MERRVKWNDLTDIQKYIAIRQYAMIREEEEECCSIERAEKEAPYCKGYYINDDDYVYVDI